MSEQQHTPGPWTSEAEPYGVSVRGPSGVQVAWCSTGMVATPDGVDVVTHTHKRANAHLIAAAPTMHDYIKKRADGGDAEAAVILEAIYGGR